jgi:L-aspartate oxidase
VIGAGLAGLTVALELARRGPVVVLAKREVSEAATAWAQGGIVGVLGSDDSVDSHVRDTQDAGAGLVDEHTARFIAEQSAAAVQWLVDQGVPFSPDPSGPLGLHLTREGGHTVRRIAHAADATGRAIHEALLAKARAHPNISLRERWMAIDLITSRHLGTEAARCYGVYALHIDANHVEALPASAVVLATGGAGKVYRYTTNPDTSTGDGIAMAWRAGCRIGNMEFIQFHPTCLYHPQERSFLITEAMRGEGAQLKLPDGTGFMHAHDPRGELAPRDIVARAIDFEMKKPAWTMLADAAHLGSRSWRTLSNHPRAAWWASTSRASRYHCSQRALHLWRRGRRSAQPCGCRGPVRVAAPPRRLHGASRLASGSLLECVVLGRTCAEHLQSDASAPAGACVGREQGRRCRRTGGHRPQLGRAAAADVELRGHRADHQAAGARAASHRFAENRDRRLLRQLPCHPRPAGTAEPGGVRRADRALGAGAPREPRLALQPRLSQHLAGELPCAGTAGTQPRLTWRSLSDHAHRKSIARTSLVSLPIEMRSTPVAATSLTARRLSPPEASRRSRLHRHASRVAPAKSCRAARCRTGGQRFAQLIERFDLDRIHPGVQRLGAPYGVTHPAAAM